MTREEKQERVRLVQSEANSVKSELMRLAELMREASPTRADNLEKIIERLEAWQHR